MFKGNGYNLSDIAAVTRNGDGMWGGDCAWWLILLFLFAGWGNGGYGGNLGGGNVRDAVAYGFDINNLENGVRGIQNGLADGFYETNTQLLTGFSNSAMGAMQNTNSIMSRLCDMSAQQAACCCQTERLLERGLCEVNYNILTQANGINNSIATATRDIIEDNNAGVRAILDFLTQDKISNLQAENQALRLTASQQAQNAFLLDQLGTKTPIPAYVVANPYASYGGCGVNAYYNSGTCCG